MTRLIHVDTDIGGDTDDLCALVMLLGWPDVELTGVTATTIYAGFATTGAASCTASNSATVTFDHVSITGGDGSGTPDFSLSVPGSKPSVNAGGRPSTSVGSASRP